MTVTEKTDYPAVYRRREIAALLLAQPGRFVDRDVLRAWYKAQGLTKTASHPDIVAFERWGLAVRRGPNWIEIIDRDGIDAVRLGLFTLTRNGTVVD